MSTYKNIILIFSLVRTVSLLSYKNFILTSFKSEQLFCQGIKLLLIFNLIRTAFFTFSVLAYIKWLTVNIAQPPKISLGATIKDPEMLRLVPDHLKTKEMWEHAVKKLPFLMKFLFDRFKTLRMCNKVILENAEMLMFILHC